MPVKLREIPSSLKKNNNKKQAFLHNQAQKRQEA